MGVQRIYFTGFAPSSDIKAAKKHETQASQSNNVGHRAPEMQAAPIVVLQ